MHNARDALDALDTLDAHEHFCPIVSHCMLVVFCDREFNSTI